MITEIKLSHSDFCAYLRNESSGEKRSEVEAISADNPAYEMLFSLVDEIKSRASVDLFPPIQGNNSKSRRTR